LLRRKNDYAGRIDERFALGRRSDVLPKEDGHDMADIEIKVGDVVQLKSGGPYLTVEKLNYFAEADQTTALCTWFGTNTSERVSQFTFLVLALAHPAQ
jgi:uncharacterized protein YodC (DUF2158 family)